ncbi:MAG: sigma-70 family RNA polymerase sigma factor [Bacteroidota bacterium]
MATTTAAPSDEPELVRRASHGDSQAFRVLVERYEGLVAATVVSMLGPGTEAEDVGQEAFLRLYRALPRFRGDAKLSTYLTRIAMNLSINALKKRQRQRQRFVSRDAHPEVQFEPSAPDPDAAEQAVLRPVIQRALGRLSPDFRAVVVLRLVKGYSTRETAELLDIPLGTVLSRLSRAQRQLRQHLAPYVEAS